MMLVKAGSAVDAFIEKLVSKFKYSKLNIEEPYLFSDICLFISLWSGDTI